MIANTSETGKFEIPKLRGHDNKNILILIDISPNQLNITLGYINGSSEVFQSDDFSSAGYVRSRIKFFKFCIAYFTEITQVQVI